VCGGRGGVSGCIGLDRGDILRSHVKKSILSGSHVEWVTLVLLALLNRLVSSCYRCDHIDCRFA
jgi:hypothetical protein